MQTELNPEGIVRRTLTRECKYHWVPGQRFVALGDDVLIFLNKDEMLWLPITLHRRARSLRSSVSLRATTPTR